MGAELLKRFYSCNMESILTGGITAWYGNFSASDRKALQRVVRTVQYITGAKLPAIQEKLSKTPATPVIDCSLYYRMASGTGVPSLGQKGSQQFLPPSHKTPEQVIKWLPGLFALCAPQTLFLCCCYSLFIIYA